MSKILSLTPEERAKGIITSSSGNHGQACAYAGEKFGMHVTVVLPNDTPPLKINNARRMGAETILWDRSYDKRWEKVKDEVEKQLVTLGNDKKKKTQPTNYRKLCLFSFLNTSFFISFIF